MQGASQSHGMNTIRQVTFRVDDKPIDSFQAESSYDLARGLTTTVWSSKYGFDSGVPGRVITHGEISQTGTSDGNSMLV